MGQVLLVRHGETPWNDDRRVQGWAPVPLSERGREQAELVAEYLADRGIDRIVASDLRRAKETAREVARATGLTPTFDGGWRERSFGVYQGLGYDELFEGYPEFAVTEIGYAAAETVPEGGESLLEARERILEAWDRVLASLGRETLAVVAHGGPIRVVVSALEKLDLQTAVATLTVPNGSVTEVAVEEEPELLSVGEVVEGAVETCVGAVY